MAYKVIKFFTDLQDAEHPYRVGDTFPRPGRYVTPERIVELAGANNLQGVPLIKADTPAGPAEPKDAPKEPAEPVKKKRSRKKNAE